MRRFSTMFAVLIISLFIFSEGIVSMAPNITECIYFIGAGDLITGRTLYCNYPEQVNEIPIIGSFTEMSFEKILKIDPKVVFFSGNLTQHSKGFLNSINMKYIDIKMESYETIFTGLLILDSIIGTCFNIDSFKMHIDSIMGMSNNKESLSVYIEIGVKPAVSAGKYSYIGSILEKMGYRVISFSKKPYISINQEQVILSNPDIVIIMSGATNIINRIGWKDIEAVKKNRVVIMNNDEIDILSRPGPRINNAIMILMEKLK